MQNIVYGYGFCLLTALIVIAGDYILKVAADAEMPLGSRHVIAGGMLYASSAVLWYYSMRFVSLAQAGIAFSMLTLLALCAMGVLIFDERIQTREIAGIGCALAAMVLLVRVT